MSLQRIVAGLGLMAAVMGEPLAAPVTYTFSTAPLQFNTAPLVTSSTFNLNPAHVITDAERAATQSLNALLAGTMITGTFVYDPASALTNTSAGVSNYIGSFTNLSATVTGGSLPPATRVITDPRGQTSVGNDLSGFQDVVRLHAEPGNIGNPALLNIDDTLGLGAFEVFNFRMFWLEGQAVPDLIGDFISSNSLPSQLPGFNGRLALDLVRSTDPGGTQSIMFYDNLRVTAVPEPGTLGLFGIALVGLALGRRKLTAVP